MYAQQAQYLHSQGVLFMNKIKDFFYNKNDIIIVLIILIAAGLIIYTRISAIMDYPETLAQQNAKAQQTTQASESKETTAAANPVQQKQLKSPYRTLTTRLRSPQSSIRQVW